MRHLKNLLVSKQVFTVCCVLHRILISCLISGYVLNLLNMGASDNNLLFTVVKVIVNQNSAHSQYVKGKNACLGRNFSWLGVRKME